MIGPLLAAGRWLGGQSRVLLAIAAAVVLWRFGAAKRRQGRQEERLDQHDAAEKNRVQQDEAARDYRDRGGHRDGLRRGDF